MNFFISNITLHNPSKHKHLIRYYGLYSSRTKVRAVKGGSLARFGYKSNAAEDVSIFSGEDHYYGKGHYDGYKTGFA